MRRTSASWLLAALTGLAFLLPSSARAQGHKIRINTIRIGFPSQQIDSQFKSGNWTPVYVDVTAGPDPVTHAKLTIEAVDTDDVRNNYTVDVPPLEPNDSAVVMAYTKPGSAGDEIGAVIRIDGTIVASKSYVFDAIPLDHHLYLTLGGRVPGLKRAITGQVVQTDEQTAYAGPEHVTGIDDIRQFPSRWLARRCGPLYLTTSDRDFDRLSEQPRGAKGSRPTARWKPHVVSVGRQDVVAQFDICRICCR